ncbi:rolling circle replication-associated protein [Dictyobacter kobayashii]|uniref:Replication-associated protein ORF2/G2P domain-containing protein n=1 Tax=Dictyobacter kobayashii TaxID=2014872 RepID=A0A402AD27_9CHLR|nr:hypothetical protein [Dictyobacter kobayashii]GCE16991.1 hypothetical protein KDK_07910 [Dictyobacter kobayashii]
MCIDDLVLTNYVDPLPTSIEGIRLAPISEQADLAEQAGTETLYFCPDSWALRHRFINQETGEVIRARCDRWSCLYCGPRKTDQWRQLIAAAEPELHVVLSRAGNTVEEAARALTTWVQFLRRGSKGRGKGRIGARPAFPIEYFAVLERHENFEESGFHWHILIKGTDYLPKEMLDAAWSSATHGKNEFAWVDRVKNARAIGYVTKYLTKHIARGEKGTKERRREVTEAQLRQVSEHAFEVVRDDEGKPIEHTRIQVDQVTSSARRIRYSRHFFPASVEELRFRLFSQLDDPDQLERDTTPAKPTPADTEEPSLSREEEQPSDAPFDEFAEAEQSQDEPPTRPRWSLYEAEPFSKDVNEYRQRRRQALLEAMMVVRSGQWRISGRVISIWSFQRLQKRQ